MNRVVFVTALLLGYAIWLLITAARKKSPSRLQPMRTFAPGIGILGMAIGLWLMSRTWVTRTDYPWVFLGMGTAAFLAAYGSDKSFAIYLLIGGTAFVLAALRVWLIG